MADRSMLVKLAARTGHDGRLSKREQPVDPM
jgi:hypothetical protein